MPKKPVEQVLDFAVAKTAGKMEEVELTLAIDAAFTAAFAVTSVTAAVAVSIAFALVLSSKQELLLLLLLCLLL